MDMDTGKIIIGFSLILLLLFPLEDRTLVDAAQTLPPWTARDSPSEVTCPFER
ncbi:MAG: hypothetical protein ABSB80_04490 [Methanoregula sp.]|uniref:hypothetical protein n=1 Tax=Methanoregula sp. TaxID=2052170 RepID=UPI003D12C63F